MFKMKRMPLDFAQMKINGSARGYATSRDRKIGDPRMTSNGECKESLQRKSSPSSGKSVFCIATLRSVFTMAFRSQRESTHYQEERTEGISSVVVFAKKL